MCPECAQGKHQNCTTYVLDRTDTLVPCACRQSDHPADPTLVDTAHVQY